jgi:hypothetical protein
MIDKLSKALGEISAEAIDASTKFRPFNSAHEGYGVLLEEVDELWEEVKVKQSRRDKEKMRAEAIQVAAMALRFVVDVCDSETVDDKPLGKPNPISPRECAMCERTHEPGCSKRCPL